MTPATIRKIKWLASQKNGKFEDNLEYFNAMPEKEIDQLFAEQNKVLLQFDHNASNFYNSIVGNILEKIKPEMARLMEEKVKVDGDLKTLSGLLEYEVNILLELGIPVQQALVIATKHVVEFAHHQQSSGIEKIFSSLGN